MQTADHKPRRERLHDLRSMPCPLCQRQGARRRLEWTGTSLACPAGHGWSNPDALIADAREALDMPKRQRGRGASRK